MRLTLPFASLLAVMMTGCEGFKPDRVVRHPDAPMLVTEVREGWMRVSAYDIETNGLIDTGWVESEDLVGWTVSKFDWDGFVNEGTDE